MDTNKKILWEKNSEGKNAFCKLTNKKKIFPAYSQKIAYSKMTDVDLISVSFSNQSILFEKWIWFLWEYEDYTNFTGLYSSYSEKDDILYICLRNSIWDRKNDNEVLKQKKYQANESLEYIISSCHLESKIIFLEQKNSIRLIESTRNIISNFKKGLNIEDIERTNPFCDYIEGNINDNYMNMHFAYVPCKKQSRILEENAKNWLEEFNKTSLQLGLETDSDMRISYRPSLWDNINSISI